MFRIKNLGVLNLDAALEGIVEAVRVRFGLDVVTSAYRPGDEGVHGTTPLRGLDMRCRDIYVGTYIANWVNEWWVYDPERPSKKCAICHDTGSGVHLHFQVHPRTEE